MENKYLGTSTLKKGMKLYKANQFTGEVSEASYNGESGAKKMVVVEEGYLYITALNLTNAERKYERSKLL
jgi:hypothetical protein